jgi:Ni/Co efflux regulator RcnB/uncharacterized membrane protein
LDKGIGMRTLARAALAGSAILLTQPVSAQIVGDPGMQVPEVRMRTGGPGPAGVTWREGQRMERRAAPMGAQRVDMRRQAGAMAGVQHRNRFPHIRRLHRGFVVPQFWWGPQFTVSNWNLYGFSRPSNGARWIRYYDDALLIDRRGRIQDGRYGLDWDRYGDRWGYDARGIPVYVGDGDFRPDRSDYDYAERWEEGEDDYGDDRDGRYRDEDYAREERYSDDRGYARGGHVVAAPSCRGACGPEFGSAWGSSAYSHGVAYGYQGPVVVTETITRTAPVVETVTYYDYVEEEVEVARPRKVRRAAKPCNCEPPPPRSGERG